MGEGGEKRENGVSVRKDSEELMYPGSLWNLFGSKECLPFSSRALTLC